METQIINSMVDLMKFVNSSEQTLYLRHSKYPQKDILRGFSINWANGSRECGLSFLTMFSDDGDCYQMTALSVAVQCYESNGLTAWLATGEKCGNGSDGEPLLSDVQMVAKLSRKCLNEAYAWCVVHSWKWPTEEDKAKAIPIVAKMKGML